MISFLHPWLLAGLAAAAFPLVLHLVNRRQPPTVEFPAVRYLIDTTREHQRRLKLRNLLLLLLRTALILALVLAAAGPRAPIRGAPSHAPAALVLVLDNSLSSGAVVQGATRLDVLQDAARGVLSRAGGDDALWLMLADGVPRRGSAGELRSLVDSARPDARRLDLGAALTQAQGVLDAQQLPGEIVLLTDLQASAVSPATLHVPLMVGRPEEKPGTNVGLSAIDPGAQPWTPEGGRVTLRAAGDSVSAPVTVRLDSRAPRQALLQPAVPATVQLGATAAGWRVIHAELDPDELLADNNREAVVRVAPVARVAWDSADHYLAAAVHVLVANGRLERGDQLSVGTLGPGPSVVEPPADPSATGALNRELQRRGVAWRYGDRLDVAATTDTGGLAPGMRVMRRYQLVPSGSGRTGVVASADGAPWIVRSAGVVLLGSRLDPAWTSLPLTAAFVPFMDALLNRVARGEVVLANGAPGAPITLPDQVTELRRDDRRWSFEGGADFRPPEAGIYFLLAGVDTVGALAVNPDPRESLLAPMPEGAVRSLWRGVRVLTPAEAAAQSFTRGLQADLRGPLLWAALILALAEVVFASLWRRAT